MNTKEFMEKYAEFCFRVRKKVGFFLLLYGISHLFYALLFSYPLHWVIPGNIILGSLIILLPLEKIEEKIKARKQ